MRRIARSRILSAVAPAGPSSIRTRASTHFATTCRHIARLRDRAVWLDDRNLVTARAILDAVREGRIDVGPLDAYWHMLIAKHDPALTSGIRVLDADRDRDTAGVRHVASNTSPDHRSTARRVCECRTSHVVQAATPTNC